MLRRRSDEREAEAAPIPTTAPALAPGASYATLPDRVYAAVALENDPWGRPLDEALSAKITGMIMDAYNPPYVESLLVDGIGPAMDEAFSVLMAAGVLQQQQFAPTVLSVPSSRDPNKRTPIASLSPDRPCWPSSSSRPTRRTPTSRRRRSRNCATPSSSASRRKASRSSRQFLGYLESSRRAAVVRLDAATAARVPAQTARDRAGLVLRPFHAPRWSCDADFWGGSMRQPAHEASALTGFRSSATGGGGGASATARGRLADATATSYRR